MINTTVGIAGFWKFHGVNRFSGKRRPLTDWIRNAVLLNGMNNMPLQTNWLQACQVGTDNTPATQNDTGLNGYIAGADEFDIIDTQNGAQAGTPWYGWKRITWRYPEGTAAANLQEIGAGWSELDGSNLASRALIVDPQTGTPTSVTPLPDELLDATYEMRYYPPLVDTTGTVTLDGVDYNWVCRAANVNSSTAWGLYIGSKVGAVAGSDVWRAFDGEIGTIDGEPSGLAANADNSNQSEDGYANNSFELNCFTNIGPTGWVLGNGIRSVLMRTTMGEYQVRFGAVSGDTTIPKVSGKVMRMGVTVNWQEATIP